MKNWLLVSLLCSAFTFANDTSKDYLEGILVYNNLDTSLYLEEVETEDANFTVTIIDPLKNMLPKTDDGKTKLPSRAQVFISNPVTNCGEGRLTFVDDYGNKVNFFIKEGECKFYNTQSTKDETKPIASTILKSKEENQLQFFIFYHSGIEPLVE